MRVTLKNLHDGSLREILPEEFPLAIGRGDQAAIQIDDRWASRRHCELDLIDGRPVVRDLDSKHGTLINGKPVSESGLESDDVLSVGLTGFYVLIDVVEQAEDLEAASRRG
jgi:pSer/pThr/pTyr-binding forkhead associated (FHA) protein